MCLTLLQRRIGGGLTKAVCGLDQGVKPGIVRTGGVLTKAVNLQGIKPVRTLLHCKNWRLPH